MPYNYTICPQKQMQTMEKSNNKENSIIHHKLSISNKLRALNYFANIILVLK